MTNEPLRIALTPTLRNLPGPPTYSVISGSATLEMSADKAILQFAGMGSDRVTIRATVVDGGVTYQDQMSFVKLVRGSSTISHVLSNEMHAVMADNFGNVLNYMGCSGQFRVWEGDFEVTTECDFEVVSTTADVLVEISNLGHYAISGIPADVDSVTAVFRATYHNVTYDETFAVTKIKAPAGGAGDPGQQTVGGRRLPMHFMVPVTGATWNTVQANQATTPYDGPVLNDLVTEYNNSANPPYKETRFWSFSEWITLEAHIDGNLLVTGTVSADKLSANAITAITGTFEEIVTDRITVNNELIADQIEAVNVEVTGLLTAARAEIEDLIATNIDAVNGNFDTLTINGTQIDPNSINTGHVVDNAINVPLIQEGSPLAQIGSPFTSGAMTGSYPGAASAVVTISVQVGAGAGADAVIEIGIILDGSLTVSKAFTTSAGQVGSHLMQAQIPVGAGGHSWAARFSAQSGAYSLVSFTMSVLGVMK